MSTCASCERSIPWWSFDLAGGELCSDCRAKGKARAHDHQIAEHERQLEADRAKRQFEADRARRDGIPAPALEPATEPLDGLILIVISVFAAIVGGMLLTADNGAFGFVVVGIAGMLYLAGVIRWAVSGSQFLQLNRLQRQNGKIIELLELIADQGRNAAELDLIRRTDEESRKQRRDLLRD